VRGTELFASLTILTPLGALVVLGVVLPLAGLLAGGRRAAAVRSALALRRPRHGTDLTALAAIVGVLLLLGLAAAQPALSHETVQRVRTDAQALFVLDTSRSMAAAAGRTQPTRLDRATAAAARLRRAIPQVASGIATLTDRVLPDLLPVPDIPSFDATLQRAVAIEAPPPTTVSARATTFTALTAIPTSGYFERSAKRRAVVLLTDGESGPFDPGSLGRSFARIGVVIVRVWGPKELVYGASGRPDAAYRPDPTAPAALDALAAATGGRAYGEGDLGAAATRLASLLGSGPTTSVAGHSRRETPLAPYLSLAALLPLALLVRRRAA
jgi:hypothetical protein